jgi:hypothetical protein
MICRVQRWCVEPLRRALIARSLRRSEKARGNLPDIGARVSGELVEYQAPIIDTIPAYPYSPEQCIAMHRASFAVAIDSFGHEINPRRRPRVAAFNTHRSLRRI